MRTKSFVVCVIVGLAAGRAAQGRPEAFEVGQANVSELPGGREADGIIGDFILRNDRVEIVVSGNLHERRANMAVLWGAPTPGCIYDLAFRGGHNDQLTLFAPGSQRRQISSVGVVKDGRDGEAIVRAELTAVAGNGLGRRHDYLLRDGWSHVVVVSTYENQGKTPVRIKPAADWLGLESEVAVDGVRTGLCQDPADRIGYAWAGIERPDAKPAGGEEVTIEPGKSASFAAALAIGHGSAEAFGTIKLNARPGNQYEGVVGSSDGTPAPGVSLRITVGQGKDALILYPDDAGRYRLNLPEPAYGAVARELGREDVAVQLKPGAVQTITVPPAAGVQIEVTDDQGEPLPCKVQFDGIEGTPVPMLGPIIRAHGCDNQYHSESGRFFQGLPTGRYRLTITHGIEYDHALREVAIRPGKVVEVRAGLKRVVDTRGWVSCDFHNHTTESGDNFCGTPDRLINLAAEQVEFAPATEHNRLTDWQPHIDRLGLSRRIKTVVGIELTGNGPHLNSFPLISVPYTQDNGGPKWDPDPRISALTLRNMPGERGNRWVQLNHPSITRYFNDVNDDKKPDSGFVGLLQFIDAAEVYGEFILSGQRQYQREWRGKMYTRDNWTLGWLQMLNAGQRVWTVATSDAHEVAQGGVGGWRTYIPSRRDEPAEIDPKQIVAEAKLGHSFVTNGPFLRVSTDGGRGPGETIRNARQVTLDVRVQCNTWTEVGHVAVLVNGRPAAKCDFRRSEHPEMFGTGVVRFERKIPVELTTDAHLIVVAIGEGSTLKTGYGRSWQSEMQPIAYHNPIFVDVDGNGFVPNRDTLGHPYLDYGFPPAMTQPSD